LQQHTLHVTLRVTQTALVFLVEAFSRVLPTRRRVLNAKTGSAPESPSLTGLTGSLCFSVAAWVGVELPNIATAITAQTRKVNEMPIKRRMNFKVFLITVVTYPKSTPVWIDVGQSQTTCTDTLYAL